MRNIFRLRQRLHAVKHETSDGARGQSLVEMAIISPLLLLLLIGVFEVGWAIRGYIVLSNANREATRLAAKGLYLDFSEIDPDSIGYASVLTHTMSSLSQQMPFDVTSGNPNGTLIISHYLVATGKPCANPPCATSEAACQDPAQREADFTMDDVVLHPQVPGYAHFSVTYGISRTSLLDPVQWTSDLKEENDAFNCMLNLKDPSSPWSVNSVIMVEAFYDQPQLLGAPIISNYFTDPVPLYSHTVMRITPGVRDAGSLSQGEGCVVYPIAVNYDTVAGVPPGQYIGDGWNGVGDGNFGWLRWNPHPSNNNANYLADELETPEMSHNDFTDKNQSDDHYLNAGDDVAGLTGVNNSSEVRDLLEGLIGQTIRVPVYNPAQSQANGQNAYYHIDRFITVRIVEARLPGKIIDMIFNDEDPNACQGNGW